MNQKETDEFVRQVAMAFPGILELLEKSPDTTRIWCRTLERVHVREALVVLERWITGDLENPPVGFRRETLALDVKAVVDRMRSDEQRRLASEAKILNGRRPRGQNPTPAYDVCRPFLDKVLAMNAEVMNGTMTREERDATVEQLLEAI